MDHNYANGNVCFSIVWSIQGSTMCNLTSWRFQKCSIYLGCYDWFELTHFNNISPPTTMRYNCWKAMDHSHLMAPKQFRLDSSYKTSEFWWHLGKILWSLLRMRLRVKYWHPCTRERSKEGLAEKAPCKYLWKHQGWVGSWYIVVYLIDDGDNDGPTMMLWQLFSTEQSRSSSGNSQLFLPAFAVHYLLIFYS